MMDEPTRPHVPPEPELEDLIVQALAALEDGGDDALDALLALHAERAADVRRALATLRHRGLEVGGERPVGTPFPQRMGHYALVRQLGGGGMGVVFLARDERLDREVAVKILRPELLHLPRARERFVREVRTVADLKHPGIVPLFGGGEDAGRPYYAMERVTGCTLHEAIDALAGSDPARLTGADLRAVVEERCGERDASASLFDGSWETVCLRIARELAEALEYAHRRGVVHRDVKPSNAMLTPSGRVRLLDFGLSSTDDGLRLTRNGGPLGTLAYMAPEALRGGASSEDSRLDIYSLGATLFELLSLELPYESEAELRAAVQEGREAPRLRERALRASRPFSWEAEVLCQVAMDPDPERRFASAGDFAREVERALEGLPLEARPPSPWLRTRRFAARHPAFTGLLGVLLLLVVGGPTIYGLQQRRSRIAIAAQRDVIDEQRAELALALGEAQRQKAHAEENFEQALAAVDTMLTRIGSEDLRDVPRLHEVRRDLLEAALGFFEGFLEERRDDPRLRHETARAWQRVGDIRGWLNDTQASAEALGASIALLEELAGEHPDDLEVQVDLLDSAAMRAMALRQLGRIDEALESLATAGRAAEAVIALAPDAPDSMTRRIEIDLQRAELLRTAGRREEALATLEPRIDDLEEMHATYPDDYGIVGQLSKAHNVCAGILTDGVFDTMDRDAEVTEDALGHHERILSLLTPVVAQRPDDARLRAQLARAYLNRGSLRINPGEAAVAVVDLERAVEGFDALVDEYPGVDVYLDQRGLAFQALGNARLVSGDVRGGIASLERAIDDLERAVEAKPDQPEPLMQLGGARFQLAMSTWQSLDDASTAASRMEDAAQLFEEALDRWPELPALRQRAAYALEYRCVLWIELGDVDRALAGVDAWISHIDDAETMANAAFYTAEAAALAEAGGDADRAAELDDRAAEHLGHAIAEGFDAARLDDEPVWAPLLARPRAIAPLRH